MEYQPLFLLKAKSGFTYTLNIYDLQIPFIDEFKLSLLYTGKKVLSVSN